jgi:hypothetical protein
LNDNTQVPANRTVARKLWVLPLSIVLGVGLLTVAIGLILDRRTPKKLDFVGACSGVVLPQETTWTLPAFGSLHLRGFGGKVQNIRGAQVRQVGEAGQWENSQIDQLELGPNPNRNTEQPSLVVEFKGRFGSDSSFTAPAGTLLQGAEVNPLFGPAINLAWTETENGSFSVQADQLLFPEVNRMLISNAELPAWAPATETISLVPTSKGFQMMTARFASMQGAPDEQVEADVRFQKDSGTAYLYSSQMQPSDGQFSAKELQLRGCINPTIKLNQQNAQDQPRDIPYDFLIQGKDIDLRTLSVTSPPPDSMVRPLRWNLGLRFTGTVNSIKVGTAELVPTELEGLLSGSFARKGVLFAVFALGLFGLTIVIKTSIERILDVLMPPANKGTHIDRQITVNASGRGNIINIADFMADVINNVNSNVDQAPSSDQVKKSVRQLTKEIVLLSASVNPEIAQQLGGDVKTLSEELKKQEPRKAWVDLNLKSIRDTTEALGAIAIPAGNALATLEGMVKK